jgi:hypothetical protein
MAHRDDELPSIDTADLQKVSGGIDPSMMMIPLLMRKKQQQAAMPPQVAAPPTPAAPPAPQRPNILVNGQPAQMDANGNVDLSDLDV